MSSERSLIEQAGIFDVAYYTGAYREAVAGMDPLDHFIAVGQHKGFKPNADFDPLIYLLRHPESKQAGPVRHFLQHPGREADAKATSLLSVFPQIPLHREWPNANAQPQEIKDRDIHGNLARSRDLAHGHVQEFTVDGGTYRLVTEAADDFFARLESDTPFAFPRLPHGFWDGLSELDSVRATITRSVPPDLLTDGQTELLARRVCDQISPFMGIYAEHFLTELLDGIHHERSRPDYLRSVSFRWQPTADERLFSRTDALGPLELDQLRAFARHFPAGEDVHESMAWKRWALSGDIRRLPRLARDRPVVLVGAGRVADLGSRWQLPWFSHVEIPLNSYTERYAILDRCQAAITEAKALATKHSTKRPLILLQGGSFAYWLIARLHAWDSSVFYLDLGQALHLWFIDNREMRGPWLSYARLIMENCELDQFYADRGIQLGLPFQSTTAPSAGLSMKRDLRPVYFQHLKKTAGTSLADTLKLFFPPETVSTSGDHLHDGIAIEEALASLQSCRLIVDHAEILSAAGDAAFKVAIFRDPFKRLLSQRRQWMQANAENIAAARPPIAAATIALQKLSMVGILQSILDYPVMVPDFWNHQAVTLGAWPLLREEGKLRRASAYADSRMHEHFASGADFHSWLVANRARIAQRARQSLNTLDYVGLTEDFDTSVQEIFARIGLPEPGGVVVRNAREAFSDEDDPQIRELAEHFLELDRDLYEAAAERHAVLRRVARGTPVDYIRRELTATAPLEISAEQPPGGHGWHVAHRRADEIWSRWSGPGPESRIALSASPGHYSMRVEVFGASSEQTLRSMQVEIDGRTLPTETACQADGLWTVTTTFERSHRDRFDFVFRFPVQDSEYGIELKRLYLQPILPPDAR